jgi:hypothetical protein
LAPALATLLIAMAVGLRLPGFDGRALWVDELWRVNLILDPGAISRYWRAPDLYTAITAPMYLAFNSLLGVVSTSPWFLRLSSFLPGLVSVVLAFAIARRSGGGFVWTFGAAMLFAANSHFIQYSNEFKPYLFEVMVHLACLYLWLRLITSKSSEPWHWGALCAALVIASLCAANIVFVLPAMALSLADKVWAQEWDKLWLAFGAFFVTGAVVVSLYVLVWSYGSDKGLINYWSDGFHDPARGNYLAFAVNRLQGLWGGAFSVVGARRGMLMVSGLGLLCALYTWWRGRASVVAQPLRGLLIYGLVLVLTLLALNWIGLWPIGEIRPNLFLFAISGAWWMIFLSILLSARAQRVMGLAAMAVVVAGVTQTSRQHFAGLGPPVEQSDKVWASFASSTPVGRMVMEQCDAHPMTVFLNPSMSHAYHYFAAFGGSMGRPNVLTDRCTVVVPVPDAYANSEQLRSRIMEARPSDGVHWHAYSHLNADEANKLKSVAREFGSLTHEQSFEGAGYFAVMVEKSVK